ncbi:MAG: hypothetical protein MUC87_22165 [Bacteroidia bacterium]|jgi:hypothetical protein|nr:hypothetical protein [Bacteroidia bacterium]
MIKIAYLYLVLSIIILSCQIKGNLSYDQFIEKKENEIVNAFWNNNVFLLDNLPKCNVNEDSMLVSLRAKSFYDEMLSDTAIVNIKVFVLTKNGICSNFFRLNYPAKNLENFLPASFEENLKIDYGRYKSISSGSGKKVGLITTLYTLPSEFVVNNRKVKKYLKFTFESNGAVLLMIEYLL